MTNSTKAMVDIVKDSLYITLLLCLCSLVSYDFYYSEFQVDKNCTDKFNETICVTESNLFYIPQWVLDCRCGSEFTETDNIMGWDGSHPELKQIMENTYVQKRLDVIYLQENSTVKYYVSPSYGRFGDKNEIPCYFDGQHRPVLNLEEECGSWVSPLEITIF